MPINPAIAMGVRGIELQDPLAQYGRVAAIQNAQQQNALANMQMQEYGRARQEEQEIRNRLAGGQSFESPDIQNFLLGSKTGRDILQRRAELQKSETEESARRAKLMADTEAMYRNMTGVIGSKQDAAAFLQRMVNDPALKGSPISQIPLMEQVRRIPDDPQGLDNWIKQFAIGSTKWTTENKPVVTARTRGDTAEIALTEPFTGRTTIAAGSTAKIPLTQYQTQQLQISRDQLVVSQGQLRNAQDKLKFEQDNPTLTIKETDNGQLIGIDSRTGAVKPIVTPDGKPVMGQTKPLTESQGTSVAYGMRMAEADKLLTALENKGLTNTGVIRGTVSGVAGAVPLIGESMSKGVDNVFNLLPSIMGGLSPEQQQTLQARINFITAVLRKESGAAISQSEFATAEKNYFPAPGDDKTVISQKQRARATAIKAMKVQAGPGAAEIDKRAAPADEWELVK